MNWLQWSPHDLAHGFGGVEVHARSLHRELQKLGVHSVISSDPEGLYQPSWDVIQTHGSCALPIRIKTQAIRIHTLHGTTLGRMIACREWLWPGGYGAYFQEWLGILQSKIVLAVHPGLHLLRFACQMRKKTAVCWNGYDSALQSAPIPPHIEEVLSQSRPFFCFVGRGEDRVKNTDLVRSLSQQVRLVAIPGNGLISVPGVITTGPLAPEQILTILKKSLGLLLCSHYEGMPLVVLEALAAGIPVFSTRVGGLRYLSPDIQGLTFLEPIVETWRTVLAQAVQSEVGHRSEEEYHTRALANQKFLPTWNQVARVALETVRSS